MCEKCEEKYRTMLEALTGRALVKESFNLVSVGICDPETEEILYEISFDIRFISPDDFLLHLNEAEELARDSDKGRDALLAYFVNLDKHVPGVFFNESRMRETIPNMYEITVQYYSPGH